VISWLTVGHPRAGVLPSIDLASTNKRHSFRIRPEDWITFLAKLRATPRVPSQATPPGRPTPIARSPNGMFRY
jgi:hypothetical protein